MAKEKDSVTVLPLQVTPFCSLNTGELWPLREKASRMGCLATAMLTPSAAPVARVNDEASSDTSSVPSQACEATMS